MLEPERRSPVTWHLRQVSQGHTACTALHLGSKGNEPEGQEPGQELD